MGLYDPTLRNRPMCEMVAAINGGAVDQPLRNSARKFEHRGYDSAGIATLFDNRLTRRRQHGARVLTIQRRHSRQAGVVHTTAHKSVS